MIHIRLKDEFERLGIKPASAAKAIGETDSQSLRDVLGGRKRLSADLLSSLAVTGIDLVYVLTGSRVSASPASNVVDVALVVRIAAAVETALTKHRARIAPAKKEELVKLLYDHFSAKGRFEEETVERHLKLVINH